MNEFTWPVRVYYEDTDAAGIVYHSNYLKYMERARTEWLRRLGFEQEQLRRGDGIVFVIRELSMRFSSPARFDELLEVRSRIDGSGGASIDFVQTITGPGERVVCEADIRVACLGSSDLKPRRLPDAIASELSNV